MESDQRSTTIVRGGKPSHMHVWMIILYPSTSAKQVVTKLQKFVCCINKHGYLSDDNTI